MTSQRTELPVAKVDFEDARTLADLATVVQDLDATMGTCSRLEQLLGDNSLDHLLIESLWTSALIRYARCFTHSRRFGLSESVFDGLQGDPIGPHRFYINLRNKHIAHSVNPFEQMEVGVVLTPAESGEKRVVGVATLAMRHVCPHIDGVHQLGMLAKVILEKVCELVEQYRHRVLEQGRQIPTDELYERGRPLFVAPGPESAGEARAGADATTVAAFSSRPSGGGA